MTILAAVHEIHHTVNDKTVVQKPGTLFDVKDADLAFLQSTGAVRQPEERELLSYQHSIGQFVTAAPAPAAPAPAVKTPAAAPAPAPAAPAATAPVKTPAAAPAKAAAAPAPAAADDNITESMLTPLRKIKRFARRDLHSHMQIPAVYLATKTTTPGILVQVRLHNKFDRVGDVKGSRSYPADIENLSPKIIFDLVEGVAPRVGAIVSFQVGEAYKIDHLIPPDDTFQTAHVTQLLGDSAAGFPVPDDDGCAIVLPGDTG